MIAFDVDGVVLDLEARILDIAEEVTGNRPTRANGHYRFHERFGLDHDTVGRIWRRFNEREMWGDLPPYPGAVEVIRAVQSMGLPIAFVTGISPLDHHLRVRNLNRLGIDAFELYCTGSAFANKSPILQRLGARAFIDDRLRHLNDASPVVDHLAWIDLGDEQEIAHDAIPHANRHESLAHWLESHRSWLSDLGKTRNPARISHTAT